MKLLLASTGFALLLAAPVQAAPEIQQVIYNVSAATACSDAAAGFGDMKDGLAACDIALGDPHMIHLAELMVDRGVIQVRLGDNSAALSDYNGAIALNAELGDAYISRAGVLVALKRYQRGPQRHRTGPGAEPQQPPCRLLQPRRDRGRKRRREGRLPGLQPGAGDQAGLRARQPRTVTLPQGEPHLARLEGITTTSGIIGFDFPVKLRCGGNLVADFLFPPPLA